MTGNAKSTERSTDRSPVIALLFAQYTSLQREQLVVATSMRVLWFILLLVFALTDGFPMDTFMSLGLIACALFLISFYSSRLVQRRESHIRRSLVRLDPGLEDYYIKALHEAREPKYRSPLGMSLLLVSRFEDVIWLFVCFNIAVIKNMIHSAA